MVKVIRKKITTFLESIQLISEANGKTEVIHFDKPSFIIFIPPFYGYFKYISDIKGLIVLDAGTQDISEAIFEVRKELRVLDRADGVKDQTQFILAVYKEELMSVLASLFAVNKFSDLRLADIQNKVSSISENTGTTASNTSSIKEYLWNKSLSKSEAEISGDIYNTVSKRLWKPYNVFGTLANPSLPLSVGIDISPFKGYEVQLSVQADGTVTVTLKYFMAGTLVRETTFEGTDIKAREPGLSADEYRITIDGTGITSLRYVLYVLANQES